jgi:hypothetical protein
MNELIIYHSLDGDVHVITRASMSKAPQKIKFVLLSLLGGFFYDFIFIIIILYIGSASPTIQ